MQNFLDPAILFFVFGVVAGLLKSDLEVPQPIAKFLSLYLWMAIGLKGGFALAASGLEPSIALSLGAALTMAFLVPVLGYSFLKSRVSRFDAAAVAASYGSVSAVTFVAAMQYLDGKGLAPGGHMAVAMVLMESPAVIVAVTLANMLRQQQGASVAVGGSGVAVVSGGHGTSVGKILHESLTNGVHMLLIASLLIGYMSGESGKAMMHPFSFDLFKGMLAFFLLDMGLTVARSLSSVRDKSPVLIAYAALAPLVHASIALLLSAVLGLPVPDATLLMVLSASASYIVVPAVLRYAIPEANPSMYLGLALGITFPLNILIGIPLYTYAAQTVLS